jgi:2-polyprenyl-3-methyl-5-hydroxy-6-metoxy-1,4-benzoquinol methylase
MDSGQIARFIGKNNLLRKLAYRMISLTTLREWYIRSALEKIIPGDGGEFTLLDAGSGMGQHAWFVANRYPMAQVTALELDEAQVEDCRCFAEKEGLSNLQFHQADLSTFSTNAQYDSLICCSVLEHIKEDDSVLISYYNMLKSDGKILIYVPTSEKRVLAFLDRKIHHPLKRSGVKLPHQHVRYYSKDELVARLNDKGFSVDSSMITYGHYGRLAYDVVTAVQYHFLFKFIFPFYLLMVHPFILLLMWADFRQNNKQGNGLLIIASKNGKASHE